MNALAVCLKDGVGHGDELIWTTDEFGNDRYIYEAPEGVMPDQCFMALNRGGVGGVTSRLLLEYTPLRRKHGRR